MENYLTVQTPSGPMDVFVAAPSTHKGKSPVVIVLQEAFGVNSHIKNICKRFSSEGYIALAPELFHRNSKHLQIDYTDRGSIKPLMGSLTNEMLMEDVAATLKLLKDLPSADSNNVFTIGFCLGGFASLLASINFNLNGSISFYGAGVTRKREGIGYTPFLKDFSKIQNPVLLFFGSHDVSITAADIDEMRNCLEKHKKAYEIEIFPGSDHGFFCDERKTYDPSAASKGWKKTLSWMKSLLRPEVK